ncbi:CHASE domain-containing sensor histidine kinase [Hyalangium versicolor]|uniref:CHASE domain-containing sensor histidine kinase n=1 Tax=Hyalangium versicolor TaxID=2861190 RepID=UPI001CCD06E5|nr:CHASE domain-containing protein [Hyalangium versicolor]
MTALAVLAVSLLLAGACMATFLVTAQSRDAARFESHVQMTQDRITAQLDSNISLLRGGAGLFAASDFVTPQEFRLYVQRLELRKHDPGVLGLGFSQRISANEKEDWTARLRANGMSSFHIWPDQPRAEYHSVIYLEPLNTRNEAALGYDMFTDPTRREAMERAWLSGEPALSGKVVLKQETNLEQQAGFLLYVPVYRSGLVPTTEAERLAMLQGFVYSPLRAKDLFDAMFPPEHPPRVFFRIYDGAEADPEQLLYDSAGAEKGIHKVPSFTHTWRLEFAGRPWTVVFTSRPSFESSMLTPWAPLVGALGFMLSLLVCAVTWTQIAARQRAEASEAERAQLLAREQAARTEAEAQRAYLNDLFMQAPALIGILSGPQHVFEFVNASYRRLLGKREVLGKPLVEVVKDLPPGILEMFDTIYRTGQPHSGQELCLPGVYATDQVEVRYWNFVWQPRRGPSGQVDGVMIFASEVTEQVLARQQVEASREEARRSARQLQTITDALPALVAYIDSEERYRFANETYETWFGIKPENLLGKTILEFIGEKAYARFRDPVQRALSGETVQYEGELPLKGGGSVFTQSSYMPDRDPSGQVRGFVVLAFDVTERRRSEETVRTAVRLRDEFLSVASHELKTPLTSLSLKLQTLAREAATQSESPFVLKTRTNVETARKQIKRLSDLIGDLLDVSRISSGKMKLHWEPVDFSAVVREVAARLEPEATRAESRLTVETPDALPGRSDRMRFEQVVENLLTNAIKYGAGKPIHIQMHADAQRLVLTVRDHGIGIAPEHQVRIFERFERAVSERNYGGLGLGLYITRTILEALGGTIRVQSETGQGACFTVELPLEPPAGP